MIHFALLTCVQARFSANKNKFATIVDQNNYPTHATMSALGSHYI